MSKVHYVKRGECLSQIATRYGFASWKDLYDAPENKTFRKLRPDPNIIAAGDEITIPDFTPKVFELATNAEHKIVIDTEPVRLHLTIYDDPSETETSADFQLKVDSLSDPIDGSLDGGKLDKQIPADAAWATLKLFGEDGETVVDTWRLQLGELDPVETLRGVQQRLQRLGFSIAKTDGEWNDDTEDAVRAFQRVHDVRDDEQPYGAATRDALRGEIK